MKHLFALAVVSILTIGGCTADQTFTDAGPKHDVGLDAGADSVAPDSVGEQHDAGPDVSDGQQDLGDGSVSEMGSD